MRHFPLVKLASSASAVQCVGQKSQETLKPIYSIWKLDSAFIAFDFCSRADSVSKGRVWLLVLQGIFFVFPKCIN